MTSGATVSGGATRVPGPGNTPPAREGRTSLRDYSSHDWKGCVEHGSVQDSILLLEMVLG